MNSFFTKSFSRKLQDHTTHLSEINERLRKSNCVLEGILKNDDADSHDFVDNWDQSGHSKLISYENNENINETSLLEELREDNANSFQKSNAIFTLVPQESSPKEDKKFPNSNKDPNRPRYTLKEMQALLEERNLYKIKMMALEEEVELLKSGR